MGLLVKTTSVVMCVVVPLVSKEKIAIKVKYKFTLKVNINRLIFLITVFIYSKLKNHVGGPGRYFLCFFFFSLFFYKFYSERLYL